MTDHATPSIDELALGAFLHDAGKLLQRGIGASSGLPPTVRDLESTLCPVYQHRYSHKHVLFSELLFHDLEAAAGKLPAGLRRQLVRDAAVWHHKPESGPAWTWLVAEADRLSSAMDRKAADVADEADDEPRGWDAFRKKPLRSILSSVRLGERPEPTPHWLRPVEAEPENLEPAADRRAVTCPRIIAPPAMPIVPLFSISVVTSANRPTCSTRVRSVSPSGSGGRCPPRPSTSRTFRCSTTASRSQPSPPVSTRITRNVAS